jgi:transcriptional regulator with XRE-family HTH domain
MVLFPEPLWYDGISNEEMTHMAPSPNNQLGEYVRARRAAIGMSMRQLEEATDIPRSGLSEIENGRRAMPGPELLQRLAEALGVDYEDLYAVSGISRPEKLPELDAYLRTRYPDVTATDRRSLERYFEELRSKRGQKNE